jgi:hypothetical protein
MDNPEMQWPEAPVTMIKRNRAAPHEKKITLPVSPSFVNNYWT